GTVKMGRLAERTVQTAKPGRHSDGDGMHLVVSETGRKKWVLRYQVNGVRRDKGLGSLRWTPLFGQETGRLKRESRRFRSLSPVREGSSKSKYTPYIILSQYFLVGVAPVNMWATRKWSAAQRERCPHIHRRPPRKPRAASGSPAPDAAARRCRTSTTRRCRRAPRGR